MVLPFIAKPFSFSQISATIEKYCRIYGHQNELFHYKCSHDVFWVKCSDILFFESRDSRHFVDAIVSGVANVIVSICYLRFVDALPTVVVIAVPIALLILNMILIYILIVRIEKQKLSKILKGGAL